MSCGPVGNILLLLHVHQFFAFLNRLLSPSADSLLAMLSGSQRKDCLLLHPEVPPNSTAAARTRLWDKTMHIT